LGKDRAGSKVAVGLERRAAATPEKRDTLARMWHNTWAAVKTRDQKKVVEKLNQARFEGGNGSIQSREMPG